MSSLKKVLEERVLSLKQEYASGQEQLRQLDRRRSDLEQTMLRIAGAIQVLEETIAQDASEQDT